MEKRIGVIQITDTLTVGGAERVAVNLANLLPVDRFRNYLCATRGGGVLEKLVSPKVPVLHLNRRRTLDAAAFRKLAAFIRAEQIDLIHAHASSLFVARVAGLMTGRPVVWHDHFGRYQVEVRPKYLYGPATTGIGAIISVNEPLAEWARGTLGVPEKRVFYIPNLVELGSSGRVPVELPGKAGKRIVCVANFRPQKDHFNLLDAMEKVVRRDPEARLFLAGETTIAEYHSRIMQQIQERNLDGNVQSLGERSDVPDVLRGCDIGVLSSESEGLPLSLLEYGAAGLATVTTDVGQCGEVLDGGSVGVLVPASDSEKLSQALLSLLEDTSKQKQMGAALQRRIARTYSPQAVLGQICQVYRRVLEARSHPKASLLNAPMDPAMWEPIENGTVSPAGREASSQRQNQDPRMYQPAGDFSR